jgi:nucleoside-diphosphate-sugar epimerase
MTAGTQTREFNFVEDLADGLVRVATTPGIDGELFNLGCGREISMRDIAALTLKLMGDPITPDFGALAERPIEIPRMYADTTKTTERIRWSPATSLEDGLSRTIAWYRDALSTGASPFAS